jgi:GntP family gluconate:H+ symporter
MSGALAGTVALAASTHLSGHDVRLIIAALAAIAAVVVLITWLKLNPFLALLLGSCVLVAVSGFDPLKAITSFTTGVGATFGGVGILVALGAMVGLLLISSGGAAKVVDSIVSRVGDRWLPWAMAGAAALIGLPMFFEIGVVLLIPIVLLVAKRSGLPILKVGIPALAGLSVLHGLVPPHPGPVTAITALHADLGLTLGLGLIIAVPAVILAGPVFGSVIASSGPAGPPTEGAGQLASVDEDSAPMEGEGNGVAGTRKRTPSTGVTVATILLPVVLMLGFALCELTLDKGNKLRDTFEVLGNPAVALLIGTLVAIWTLGGALGASRRGIGQTIDAALPPMAGTLLIIAAGGGFKQTLSDSGIADLIGRLANGAHLNVLLLGWLVAVAIRLATGSATVSTITAAGIVGPLATHLPNAELSLLVLAIGSGSLFFSHVNDVGFWLIKQYFGLTVGQTLKSWSVMETIISVVGLGGCLLLDVFV